MKLTRFVLPFFLILFFIGTASAQNVSVPSEIPIPPNAKQESGYQLPGKMFARYMVPLAVDGVKEFYNKLDESVWKAAGDWSAGRKKFNKADGGKHSFSVTLTDKGQGKTLAILTVSM